MGRIAEIANIVRRLSENKEEEKDPSGGFLPFGIRLKALSLIHRGGSLLDIGCGEGLFLRRIPGEGLKRVYGIDPWDWAIRKAQGRVSAPLLIGVGEKLPFKNEAFDEVSILNLFYNLPSKEHMAAILKETFRVLRTGGRVLFDYRSKSNPFIRMGYKTAKIHDPALKIPVNTYSRREVQDLLGTIGGRGGVMYHNIPTWWKINPPVYLVEVHKGRS